MASPPRPGQRPQDDDPQSYLGLAEQEAEQRARTRGWQTVRTLPPGGIVTMEYREGRLNFTVEGGRVIRSWQG
jgi:hypothetical protein